MGLTMKLELQLLKIKRFTPKERKEREKYWQRKYEAMFQRKLYGERKEKTAAK